MPMGVPLGQPMLAYVVMHAYALDVGLHQLRESCMLCVSLRTLPARHVLCARLGHGCAVDIQ